MELNCQQKFAVEHGDGPLLILAGAGSGKTRVLTERITHLVRSKICYPSQILAVTFTNKAAAEMRGRVEAGIGPLAKDVWLNTFHSACVKILRRFGESVGLSRHFTIFDGSDQISLARKILIELNISDKLVLPRTVVEKISRAKDNLIPADDFPDGDFYQAKMALVYRRYDKELRKAGAVDFGDLIMLTVKLFKTVPDALEHYQNRFHYIMIDEYQDTNHAQYELIKCLAAKHRNICVVGDPDQSIYAWRGADISNILEFERDFPGAKVIKLEQNYRSTKNILAASDAVIANNASRKEKTLWTENEDGELIRVVETPDERREGRAVAGRIKELVSEGVKLSDTAVFYRTNAQSRVIEDELRQEGIPYVIYGGVRFYDRAEIKNSIAYLRLIENPSNDVSLNRVINIPARGLGKTTVEKITAYASAAGISIYEFITTRLHTADLNSGTKHRLASFAGLIKELGGLKGMPLPQLVTEALAKTGYAKALAVEKTDESSERIANIDELISAVSEAYKQSSERGSGLASPSERGMGGNGEFDEAGRSPHLKEMTLADFLDQVALVSDIDKYDGNSDVLPLMTLHLAKGLEFDNVFIVGMEEGMLPHARALNEDKEMEEERRLFYVGMTRAKKALYLFHAGERMVRGNYSYNVPSRFLEEIPLKYVERPSVAPLESSYVKRFAKDHFLDDFSQVLHDDDNSFKVGQRVRHPTFGDGIIRKAEGPSQKQKLIVQFKSGELKKLSTQHANLTALS